MRALLERCAGLVALGLMGFFAQVPTPLSVDVHISRDGVCSVLGSSLPCSEVGQRLLQLHARKDCVITVSPDRETRYEAVMQAIQFLQREHFVGIRFPEKSSAADAGT